MSKPVTAKRRKGKKRLTSTKYTIVIQCTGTGACEPDSSPSVSKKKKDTVLWTAPAESGAVISFKNLPPLVDSNDILIANPLAIAAGQSSDEYHVPAGISVPASSTYRYGVACQTCTGPKRIGIKTPPDLIIDP